MTRLPVFTSICLLPLLAIAAIAAPPAENSKLPPERMAELTAPARD